MLFFASALHPLSAIGLSQSILEPIVAGLVGCQKIFAKGQGHGRPWNKLSSHLVTLRAKFSCAVYCNRSCLWVCLYVCLCMFVCLWVCYHDNSKLRASILTKLGLHVKVVTISSWLNFGRPVAPGRGSAAGWNFLAPPYYSQHTVFASLWALFSFHKQWFWINQLQLHTLECDSYLAYCLSVIFYLNTS